MRNANLALLQASRYQALLIIIAERILNSLQNFVTLFFGRQVVIPQEKTRTPAELSSLA